MQPLNEALSNSRSGPSPPMAQPMMYHDLDLANIQREDNAEKNSSNRNNNAGKAQLEPSSVVEEITYPRVSHGKPPIQILLCNENESDHLGSIWHFSFSLIVYFRSTQHQYYIKRYKKLTDVLSSRHDTGRFENLLEHGCVHLLGKLKILALIT